MTPAQHVPSSVADELTAAIVAADATALRAESEPTEMESLEPQPLVRGGSALWALFVGFGLLMVGNGLNLAVLGVRVVDEGFGLRTSGYVMSCYFAGFLVGPPVIARLLATVGHIRVFAGLASLGSCSVLIQAIAVHPVSWGLMRMTFGFCLAGLYVVLESWLNDASTPATRGRTLAVYMVVSMGGLAVGQFFIAFADTAGYTLFIIAALLVSVAVVPVTLAATTQAPPVREAERLTIRELFETVPTGLIGMLFVGMSHGVLFGLGAVYAGSVGYSASRLAVFLVLPTLGALTFQMPIGLLSDRVSRRAVIFGVAAAAAAMSATLAVLPSDSLLVLVGMFVLGGLTFPLYSLVLSYTLDWSAPGKAIGASGTLLRINGGGAVVGPIVAASVLGGTGPAAFFWTLTVTHGMIVLYVGYRIASVAALPMDRQGRFVSVPFRSSEFAIRLAPRALRASRAALRRTRRLDERLDGD